jgi:SNF2 family DNA or RNA helicase
MGLGKTLQALAIIVENQAEDRSRRTTLVVAPVALLFQWKEEIADKIKRDQALKVYVHHGQKKKPFRMLRDYDVVLTTYGSLASELKRYDHWCAVVKNDSNAMPAKNEQMSLLGPECKWYRVILDEAQCIKNKDTAAAKAAYKLDSIYRWCMTGTPMMNNVFELYSLIHFCRIRPYNDIRKFRNDIKNPLDKRDEGGRAEAMKTLQALIRGVMLRRTKQSKIDGKPIITLPPRTNEVVPRAFEKDQEDFYRAVELQSADIFSKYLKAGTVMRNYGHVLTLLLRLRQITDHPTLATQVIDDSGVETSEKDMLTMVNKLSPDVIRRLKAHNGEFMCPICIDAIPKPGPIIFFPCGHYLDNDCLSSLVMNATANADTEVKCPECRDKFDPKKVIDYPTFVKVHMPEQASQEVGEEQGAVIDEDDDSDLESDSDSDDEGSLKDFIVDDATEDEAEEANDDTVDEDEDAVGGEPVPQSTLNFMRNGADGRHEKGKGKGKQKKERKKKKKSLAELRKEGRKNKKAWQKYLRRLEKTWETSAKIEQTLELLQKIDAEKPKEKVLIFSQFTSFLDFLEVPLRRAGYVYERYDGSMNAKEREAAVNSFKSNPRMKLMLISLKAGNSGLNLNCASQVIILDPFWNPFIEEQAIDRAHRIGQQHEVNVHRIVIPNTVEDRILQLQEKKRDLINTALDEKAGKNLSRLGVRELGYLFGVNAAPT